jgi:uncharacterized protein YutE (UPF0331/DUF86 family)
MRDLTVLKVYLYELNQQVEGYLLELDELANTTPLANRDYYAAERLLQVLIEACIGISKHWLKFLGKSVPNDAYKSFELLVQYNLLPAHELATWRKVIGLRNALVHDYLNLDRRIVLTILQEKHYQKLGDFITNVTASIKQQLPT